MVTVAGTVMRSPDPKGAPRSTLMGSATTGGVDVGCTLPALLGLVPIPSAPSREAYAWATAADPVTGWAGSEDRLLSHVVRRMVAAADACWRRIAAADLACTTTN